VLGEGVDDDLGEGYDSLAGVGFGFGDQAVSAVEGED
jgi:hypothetical protein